jgi:hypothetical protein
MPERLKLTQEDLKRMLHYEPETGIFSWKVKPNNSNIEIGREAGGIVYLGDSRKPYRVIGLNMNIYKAHRLAFLYMTGKFPKLDIDHIDGNGINNKWNNLREVTRSQNCRNIKLASNNTSGFIGVRWNEENKKWRALIGIDRKSKHLGYFDNLEEAIMARKNAERMFGFHPNHGRNTD